MPPEQETPTVTPEGVTAAPAETAAVAVTPVEGTAPPEPKLSQLAEYLKDEANRAEFTTLSLEITQPHFDAMKASHEQAIRSMKGQLSQAEALKGLDEEGRKTLLDVQALRDDAIAIGVEKGISKKVLDESSSKSTPKRWGHKSRLPVPTEQTPS